MSKTDALACFWVGVRGLAVRGVYKDTLKNQVDASAKQLLRD